MIKYSDWEVRLAKLLTSRLGQAFEWGLLDCTTLTIDCIKAMTPKKLEIPLIGYRSKEEAEDFSQHFSLYEGMIEQLDAFLVQPNFQQNGDVIFVWENEVYPCVHICAGEKSFSSIPGYGVRAFSTAVVIKEGRKHSMKILRFN